MLDLHRILRLKDGRNLGWGQYGDPEGKAVFFFHGTPGSRMMRHPDISIAEDMGIRVITSDRPGFGLSTPKSHRTLLDWPEDVIELADSLGIDRFAVVGFSGGGPHAAACAYKIPERLTSVTLVSSLPPHDLRSSLNSMPLVIRILFAAARHASWGLRPLVNPIVHVVRRHFDFYYEQAAAKLVPADRELFLRHDIRNIFRESLGEAFQQGNNGFLTELKIHMRPWGFHLQDLSTKIFLWHGELDQFDDGRALREAIPGSHAISLPTEGHLVFFRHWPEILAQLVL